MTLRLSHSCLVFNFSVNFSPKFLARPARHLFAFEGHKCFLYNYWPPLAFAKTAYLFGCAYVCRS
jgi:hypothetical protein